MLIGGLGMGFTLRAALAAHGPDAQVTVAELVPAVIAWARGPLASVFGDSLTDPRVSIVEGDVAGLMAQARRAWLTKEQVVNTRTWKQVEKLKK